MEQVEKTLLGENTSTVNPLSTCSVLLPDIHLLSSVINLSINLFTSSEHGYVRVHNTRSGSGSHPERVARQL